MKSKLRSIRSLVLGAAVGLSLLLGRPPAVGQTPPLTNVVTVGGVTTQQGNGPAWAYLFWQTDSVDLLKARTFSIWQKPGAANAVGSFERVGIVTMQSDPKSIAGIIDRATSGLGENPAMLDGAVSSLFENLMPTLTDVPAPERLAAKVSAVLRGVKGNLKQTESLLMTGRFFASMAMSMGSGYAVKIPASGPMTFEVREYLPATQTDVAVLGRVTVNHAVPLILPVPTLVQQVPDLEAQGFNHLNIKLAWDTPDDLRKMLPLTQGFNLYRVKRATAELPANDWDAIPPHAYTLATQAMIANSNVSRVNVNPITTTRALTAAEALGAQPGDQCAVDDAMRLPGYPAESAKPKNGDQYYYFVTSRDRLGRDHGGPTSLGRSSPGLLATFCDRMAPEPPTGLKVTNEYGYNNGTPTQKLRLTWKANDNAGEKKTTAYVVYRWATNDGPLKVEPPGTLPVSRDPLAHLIAGPIPHTAGNATFTYLDNGVGSPAMPADVNQTYWYTVRAIDNAVIIRNGLPVCDIPPFGGNLSPNSPSAYGTLRDRVGLDEPDSTIQLLCPVPSITALNPVRIPTNTLDPEQRFIELVATRPLGETNLVAVDFERQFGATWIPLGRFHFPPTATTLTKPLTIVPGSLGDPITIRARSVNITGETSAYAATTFIEPPALVLFKVIWDASITYARLPLSTKDGRSPCTTHTIPPPGSGITAPGGNDILIQFTPPVGMKQYKLYYRIDGSALTLAKEDSQNFTAGQILTLAFGLIPVTTSEVCLFLQIFDNDGNPSPMSPLGCLTIQGAPLPKPMLAPIASIGTDAAPTAAVQWFCPPHGVESFEVWISCSQATLPPVLGTRLKQDPSLPTGTSIEPSGTNGNAPFTYQIYHTDRVGPLFGNGSVFSLNCPVTIGQEWRVKVRAISEANDAGPFSNVETYQWALPVYNGPDVPWPARPLPSVGDASGYSGVLSAVYFPTEGFVGVELGALIANSTLIADQGRQVMHISTDKGARAMLYSTTLKNPDSTNNMLPCLLYRTQVADLPNQPAGKLLANFPTVPGDIVQVSPLIDKVAAGSLAYPGGGPGVVIYDPFFHVTRKEIGTISSVILNKLYLKDTTPVISGARYVYLLVLLDRTTKEISQILPLPAVDIP